MSRIPLLALAASMTLGASVFADQLIESGSFEYPRVTKRKARSEGANVAKSAMNPDWASFTDKADAEGGRLVLGLTNEIAHSGRQSLFVQFDKLTKKGASALLASDLLPVLPGQPYRMGIWGRVDKANPVALDTRLPFLRLRVDWFKNGIDEDTEEPAVEQTGEPSFSTQTIPGAPPTPDNPSRKPFFTANRWSQFWADVKSPDDANFVKISWTWETSNMEGETNGVAFFDDATMVGVAGPKVDPFADDPDLVAEMEATKNDPNLVQPDVAKPAIDVTPLTTPNAAPGSPTPPAALLPGAPLKPVTPAAPK